MDYRLKPLGRTCEASGEELAPGRACYSALVHRAGALVRLDYSEEAWNGPPEGAVGFWKTAVPQPHGEKPRPLDADALMRHFEQLCEDAIPATEKFRYVLALLLLQKRRLEIEGTRREEDDEEYLRFVGTHGEGAFEVRDHHLAGEEIERLQAELDAHLAGELQ